MVRLLNRVAEEPAGYSHGGDEQPIPESALARLWQKRADRQEGFRTAKGRRVRVLYPGRPGKTAGPDFRDAVLEFEDVGRVQGDVEIHLRQRDWNAHGHNDDPNYNGVVLHAALDLSSEPTNLSSGGLSPVISLQPLLADENQDKSAIASTVWGILDTLGYSQPGTAQEMSALLERAGDVRFLAKSQRFQKFLQEQDAEQTLYEGLFESLGYRGNQQTFLKLAGCAPYSVLARAAGGLPLEQRVSAIESWLLDLAGLVPEGGIPAIPRPRAGWGRAMSGREWHCFRVRPANHPRRRIGGAARLLARLMDSGLLNGLQTIAASPGPKQLTDALTIADGGTTYIGPPRAREMAVNVVLPFFHGLAASQGDAGPAQTYLKLYGRFGRLPDNEITREMASQLFNPSWEKVVTTARRQQGLIHLQRLLAGAAS